ncbi:unnamed protein product [Hermetia illucens]|uniref:Peptidase S1 domain-containing protein n=1 Tax=Hermetia illucens TaxID=343691 RepID=A0A7R8UMQ3_HERIL|nr:unnamed protein product [Hermetia illucens]
MLYEANSDCGISNYGRSPRLDDGDYVRPAEYPWIVFINTKTQLKAGTLINDLYVITSASNVYREIQYKIKIYLGKYQKCDSEKIQLISGVSNVIIHPGFIHQINIQDIALLQLTTRVEFNSHISPICLPSPGASYVGKLGVVIGFIQDPSETVTGKINTCLPRKTILPIVGQADCNRPIYSFELCLGVVGADNIVCAQDNGAGVIHKSETGSHEIAGVISDKQSCPPNENVYYSVKDLAVMTSLEPHLNWILDNTKDACYCTKF